MLEIQDLHVAYGAIRAIHGVNLSIEAGEILSLIGANGAGKTTMLRAISGLLKPVQGRIVFEGQSIGGWKPHKIARLGLVQAPEGRGVFSNLTVAENLALGAYARRDRKAFREDRERALALFPRLADRLSQNAGTLSGGEQQMLAIGRALLAQPRLLLLDEPSLGLAPQIVQTIFRIIRDINAQGTTILLVEQNAHMALQVAHRAAVLETGEVVMSGSAAELEASDEVRKAYLGVS